MKRPLLRWLLLLLGSLLALPVPAQEPPEWFAETFLDLREDAAEAARDGRRLMLYFMQDGCPYCKRLVTVNWRDPQIVEKTRRHFVPVAINIWGDREVTLADGRRLPEKRFAAALKVQFTPTLLFFDEHGALAYRIEGYLPPREFSTSLDAAIRSSRKAVRSAASRERSTACRAAATRASLPSSISSCDSASATEARHVSAD